IFDNTAPQCHKKIPSPLPEPDLFSHTFPPPHATNASSITLQSPESTARPPKLTFLSRALMSEMIEQAIKESPLFKHLSEEDAQQLVANARLAVFQTGEIIIAENA